MSKIYAIKPGVALKGRQFKGLRGFTGKPFHPPLTDFPIAGYVFAGMFDALSYLLGGKSKRAARDLYIGATYTMGAGAITSVGTILTGFWDWWKGIDRDKSSGPLGRAQRTQVWRTVNWHASVMVTVTAIVVADLIVRAKNPNAPHASLGTAALSSAAAALVSYGALYGGELVYDFQFNVESLEGSTAWDETEKDQMPAERPQSEW
jgi:uncharacterized membrane protein